MVEYGMALLLNFVVYSYGKYGNPTISSPKCEFTAKVDLHDYRTMTPEEGKVPATQKLLGRRHCGVVELRGSYSMWTLRHLTNVRRD